MRSRLEDAVPDWFTGERVVVGGYLLFMALALAVCVLGITGVIGSEPSRPTVPIQPSDVDFAAHR